MCQVPSFVLQKASSTLTVTAKKLKRQQSASATVVILSVNATVKGGIKNEWLVKGLQSSPSISVASSHEPAALEPCHIDCTTITLHSSTLTESHVSATLGGVDNAGGYAEVHLTFSVLKLPGGLYNFSLAMPVPNSR